MDFDSLSNCVHRYLHFFWIYLAIAGSEYIEEYPMSVGSFRDIQYFGFDPNTILLKSGQDFPKSITPQTDFSNIPLENSAVWREEDFEALSNAMSQFIWNESFDQWKLLRMNFFTKCNDNLSGFDLAEYVYFKEITQGEKRVYSARAIYIDLEYGNLAIGSGTNFPRSFWGWKSINLDSIKTKADVALQLAEERGRKDARLRMKNKCNINVYMSPELYNVSEWKIIYNGNLNSDGSDRDGFGVYIEP